MTSTPAPGSAFLIIPETGPGPGVLLLHSWWGLTPELEAMARALAVEGYSVLVPNLFDADAPADAATAERLLLESDPNITALFVLSSIVALRANSADPTAPVAVVGFSMGASWALWAATRQPQSVNAVVAYYGTQDIDFEDLNAPVLGHFAEDDALVTDDDVAAMQAHLLLLGKSVEVHRYPGTRHWFAEPVAPDHYDVGAAALAWDRTLEFLAAHRPASW
ncbi:MAG: dienelactone hydrolase family protein [Actinomycetes bacterium]